MDRHARNALLSGALRIGLLTVAAKAVTVLREAVVAGRYGRGDQLEVFMTAIILPVAVSYLLASAFEAAITPRYAQVRAGGHGLSSWTWAVLARLGAALVLGTAGCAMLAPWLVGIIAAGFTPEKRAAATALAPWACLLLPPLGLGLCISGLIKAHARFAVPTLVTATTPIMVAAAILASATPPAAGGLVAATVSGACLELLIVLLAWRRLVSAAADGTPGMPAGRLGLQFLAALATGVIAMLPGFVDQAVATRVDNGALAGFGYAQRIITPLLGLAAAALGTAALPLFNDLALGDRVRFLAAVRQGLLIAAGCGLVAGLAVLGLAGPIVAIVLRHGAFGEHDAGQVVGLLRWFAPWALLYPCQIVAGRALAALGRNHLVLLATTTSTLVWIALDLILAPHLGIVSLAVGAAGGCACGLAMSLGFLRTAHPVTGCAVTSHPP